MTVPNAERTEKAVRFGRVVKTLVAAFVALYVVQIIGIAVSTSWPVVNPIAGEVESVLWIVWFALFLGILPAATLWLLMFGRHASVEKRLKHLKLFMIVAIIVWILLVTGLLALFVIIARGLINFI